jgi:single-strand DNA-binding protein
MSVNKVTILGNLTQDPVLKSFDNGGKIATFGVATNEMAFETATGTKVPERTEYHNIIVRNKLAEVAEKYLRKGNKIYLEGVLRYRSYQDAEAKTKWVTEIHVSSFEMLTTKGSEQAPPVENHTDENSNQF